MEKFFVLFIAAFIIFAAIKIFTLPLRFLCRLLINTILGFVFLFVFNWVGSYIGLSIGMNILNAVIVGTLGLPGLALLILLKTFTIL